MGSIEVLKWPFSNDSIDQIDKNEVFLNYPVIYILNGNKEAYIGETVYFKKRMKAHLKMRKNLSEINLIKHEKFNRSATFHLETKLINYFLGDEKYILQNKSKTQNDFTHNYYDKPYYDDEVFKEVWKKLLEQKLVDQELHVIENKDIFKLSPFKELSLEQLDLKEKVLEFCEKQIQVPEQAYGSLLVIEGEAGVGKSVVLSSIFNTIQERTKEPNSNLKDTENYLVVHHEEMYKTYQGIAKKVKHLKSKDFSKPTPLINKLKKENKKVDILLVDEAHLLLTKQDVWKNFKDDNHLEELLKLAKIVIIIFDKNQILKIKSFWDKKAISRIKKLAPSVEEYKLTNQFRMQAPSDVMEWVNELKEKNVTNFPKQSDDYEFKVFETMKEMHEVVKERNEEYGLSRVVSTFDYLHMKDGETYYVKESNGDYQLPWNTTSSKYTWAEKPETIDEVGSIYTVQGFDLNYVGVVLGPSVQYDDKKEELVIDYTLYKDKEAYAGMSTIENVPEAKEQIVLNSINVLLKRGIKGLYIYASNEKLRNKLLEDQRLEEENE